MSFTNMFPNASEKLKNLRKEYKNIKKAVSNADSVSAVNACITDLVGLIEKQHKLAQEEWKSIQTSKKEDSALKTSLIAWADWIGFQRLHSYLPQTKSTFENLKKEFINMEKNATTIKQQYQNDPYLYEQKVLGPLCQSAKNLFNAYDTHKEEEMAKYKAKHPDVNFESGDIFAYWALLRMIHTSAHDPKSGHEFGFNYIKTFGGGFLGLIFAKINDIQYKKVFEWHTGPTESLGHAISH